MKLLLTLTLIIFTILNSNSQNYVYWSSTTTNDIKRSNLDGANSETVIIDQNTPRGIAIDYEHGKLYFADGEHNAITAVNLDGSNSFSLVYVDKPIDIFIDKSKYSLFYNDLNNGTISCVNIDGTDKRIIISDLLEPGYIDGDIIERKIYFTSQGSTFTKIYRVDYEGTNLKELIHSDDYISGLAIDAYNKKLYWTDRGLKKLLKSDLNGTNIDTVTNTSEITISLEIDNINGKLYWAEKDQNRIRSVNLDGSDISTFATNVHQINGIAIDIKNGCTQIITVYDTISVTDTLYIDVDFTSATNINDINTIKIYPNPAKDILFINTGEYYSYLDNYSISILSVTGQKIFKSKINSDEFKINISEFQSTGLFYVNLLDENQNIIATKKLVLH